MSKTQNVICEILQVFLSFLISGLCVTVWLSDEQKQLCQIRFHEILWYCLQIIRPFLNQEFSIEHYPPTSWHCKIFYRKILSCNGDSKLQALICEDKWLWPLPVIKGVVLVWTIESGLKSGQRLQRELRITVQRCWCSNMTRGEQLQK